MLVNQVPRASREDSVQRIASRLLPFVVSLLSVMAFLAVAPSARAAQPAHPIVADGEHLGLNSCAGSTCHSRQAATGPVVRQNEIVTWQDETSITGAHARAYDVLLTEQGQRIARLAGFGAAQRAPECLSCHTHLVPESKRGPGYSMTEGVTCEACHGPAENWLTQHYAADATHENNVELGLYPLSQDQARASLCLDCHFGSDYDNQFVTHRIMGAGHPRMSFELDLFTALQAHYDIDADYVERKGAPNSIRTWAVGQAMAIARAAELFADDDLGRDGLFPELYFFDCHSCHRTISNDPKAFSGWRPNPARPLGPGVPVFNDANLIMLKAALGEVAPAEGRALDAAGRELHTATQVSRTSAVRAARDLAMRAERLADDLAGATFDKAQTLAILNRILDSALTAEYTNYAGGEQAVIAVDVFLNAMVAQGLVDEAVLDRLGPQIDRAYASVDQPNTYNPAALRRALDQIAAETRRL